VDAVRERLRAGASAYVRARQADPKSSSGDFVTISGGVDVMAARALAGDVSDGVIAAGFEPDALDLLRGKKGAAFIVLRGSEEVPSPESDDIDIRTVGGIVLRQRRGGSAGLFPALGDWEKTGRRVATRAQPTREVWADLALAAATSAGSHAYPRCADGRAAGKRAAAGPRPRGGQCNTPVPPGSLFAAQNSGAPGRSEP
jgi:phosphoribosylaminoimidazolecarboxamide formyltransferase / IMP cyclohydrolase